MMTGEAGAVKARVVLGRGAFEVAFLESGEAVLSCGHVAECPRCYSAWELGEAEAFAPDQAQHLALALRPLLSAQELRAIREALREALEPIAELEAEGRR